MTVGIEGVEFLQCPVQDVARFLQVSNTLCLPSVVGDGEEDSNQGRGNQPGK